MERESLAMASVSYPVAALAGMALYVGLYHLTVHLRRPDPSRRDLYFAVSALLLAAYDAVSIGLYESRDVATGSSFQRLQLATMALTSLPFVRFVEAFSGTRPHPMVRAIGWAFPVVAVIAVVERAGLTLLDAPSVKHVNLVFGGEVTYYERVLGPLGIAIGLAVPYVVVCVASAARALLRAGRRAKARWLIAATGFFAIGLVNDTMVASGVFESVYFIEYSWTGMIVLTAFSLSEEIVEASLAKNELLESRTRLAHAERLDSVGKLAGGVAHDLNNMLTPVLSYSELARRRIAKDSKEYEYLSHVISAAERAASLTHQLLAFGRKQVLEVQPIDLGTTVIELTPLLERLLPETIALRTFVEPSLPAVVADRAQLEQVLMNLVANARDAIGESGDIAIAVSASARPDGAKQVHVEVRDSGSGMDEDTARKIFEPFFTTKPRGKGTGLGLSIVHGIVSQHGGSIDVVSALGRGTTIRIDLPAVAAEVVDERSPARLRLVGERRGARILVADDDPVVRRLIEEILVDRGYRVRTAGSFEEVRALLATGSAPFELLVSDVMLDDGSGPEVRSIVEASQGPIACLYVSGHAEEVLAPRGMLEPGTWLLHKPFTPDELAANVRRVLDQTPAAVSVRANDRGA